jgi:hypothetical protein
MKFFNDPVAKNYKIERKNWNFLSKLKNPDGLWTTISKKMKLEIGEIEEWIEEKVEKWKDWMRNERNWERNEWEKVGNGMRLYWE